MRKLLQFVLRWCVPWFVPLWLIYAAASWLWPASFWMDVRSVHVSHGKPDEPILMVVDRTIHRDFNGQWAVVARSVRDDTPLVVCAASSALQYREAAALPVQLTLGWWTNGHCTTLPEGVYIIDTMWRIEAPWLLKDKYINVMSNIFEVKP